MSSSSPRWSTLRKGDVLVSKIISGKSWITIFLLEDATQIDDKFDAGTRTFQVSTTNRPDGVYYIRRDDHEIDLTLWEVIRR